MCCSKKYPYQTPRRAIRDPKGGGKGSMSKIWKKLFQDFWGGEFKPKTLFGRVMDIF